jgi:hypothetical protein
VTAEAGVSEQAAEHTARDCPVTHALLFFCVMADPDRQVLAPAGAWLLDLTAVRGPRFVVLRDDETEARTALVAELVEIGTVSTPDEAQTLIDEATAEPVGVVW